MKKLISILLLILFITPNLSAKDEERLVNLTKQIIEAKSDTDLTSSFEELKELYFKENKHSEFVDLLKSLVDKKKGVEPLIDYYAALSRYTQLRHLEESQAWEEYFNKGESYREEITSGLKKTIEATKPNEILHLDARFLAWQFHKTQEDVLADQALSELVSSSLEYAKTTKDTKVIKGIADKLMLLGEKGRAQELYNVYVERIVDSDMKSEELKEIALGFYKEGNSRLAENLYDLYIDRIIKTHKEKAIPLMVEIAKQFAISDKPDKMQDAFYAEKVFKRVEDLGKAQAFDERLAYLRAFNMEKAKDYKAAKDLYLALVQNFPETSYFDEAIFKVGIIYTYALRDIKNGKVYFGKLAQKETISAQVISSFYQLGVLSQWEDDLGKAKEFYGKVFEKAKTDFQDTVELARERTREIDETKALDYNLKTFLDVSLKEYNSTFDMSKVWLDVSLYRLKKEQEVRVMSNAILPETGCMSIEAQYLWSGHLGTTKPTTKDPEFTTTHKYSASKEINLVVVTPRGVVDRSLSILDID